MNHQEKVKITRALLKLTVDQLRYLLIHFGKNTDKVGSTKSSMSGWDVFRSFERNEKDCNNLVQYLETEYPFALGRTESPSIDSKIIPEIIVKLASLDETKRNEIMQQVCPEGLIWVGTSNPMQTSMDFIEVCRLKLKLNTLISHLNQ